MTIRAHSCSSGRLAFPRQNLRSSSGDHRKYCRRSQYHKRPRLSGLCRAQSLWLVDVANDPAKGLAALGIAAASGLSIFGAWLALRAILWDYTERRSDDASRPYDLFTDLPGNYEGGLTDLLGGGADYLLTQEELAAATEEPADLEGSFYVSLVLSDSRRWCSFASSVLFGQIWLQPAWQPVFAFQLIDYAIGLIYDPPKKNYGKPLKPLLLTADVIDGIAIYNLRYMLQREVKLGIDLSRRFLMGLDSALGLD